LEILFNYLPVLGQVPVRPISIVDNIVAPLKVNITEKMKEEGYPFPFSKTIKSARK
jgi:hypothetical protein